jgi:hypothetical protein
MPLGLLASCIHLWQVWNVELHCLSSGAIRKCWEELATYFFYKIRSPQKTKKIYVATKEYRLKGTKNTQAASELINLAIKFRWSV